MLEQQLLENYTTAVLAADRKLQICYANPAAELFWRLQSDQLAEYSLPRLFGKASPVVRAVERALTQQISTTIEAYAFEQGPGLNTLTLRVQVDPVLVSDTAPSLGLLAFWDQTQRQNLDSVVNEERVLESIGFMTQRLAHELQNPLSGIKGATQLLARRVRESPELREYPAVIQRELERLERLVGRLAQQGDQPQLNQTACNLHELLDTVLWFEQNANPQTPFERDYDPSLPTLIGDPDRLHQVFLNLIHNAIEASPPEAAVTLRTRMSGPWEQHPALPDPSGTYFVIEVLDRGSGVPENMRPNLFTPFFTTKRSGTGLGLSISHHIVHRHEGHLIYRPAPGGGAQFTVLLPLKPHPPAR